MNELQKAAKRVETWLQEMGLHLHPGKTKITHTLDPHEGNVGFDFLGFTIRQYRVGKTHSGKYSNGKLLGFKTHITPSKTAIKRHTHDIKLLVRKRRAAPQGTVIRDLNPVIRGWTNSYKWVICSQAFDTCDYHTFKQLARWGKTRHHGKGKQWAWEHYTIILDRRRKFGQYIKDKEGNLRPSYVRFHTDTHSQNYIKVRGQASPYDGNLIYWTKRLKQHPLMKNEKAKLLAIQKGQCPRCGLYFQDGDILEIDHSIPLALGGRNDSSNKWVYHRHCHDEKTAEDLARIARYKAAGVNYT